MNKSFLITPGYKLSGKEYSGLVKRFSNTVPTDSTINKSIQNRFLSLIDKIYIENLDLDNDTFAIPTQKDAKLILAYGNLCVRMNGDVPEEYYKVIFNTVKRIPFFISRVYDKTELETVSEFISAMIQIAKVVSSRREVIFIILSDVIHKLFEDPSKNDLLYTVLQAFSDWKEMYPFAHDGLMSLASYLLDQIISMKDYLLQLKGSEFIEISQRLSILLAIESQIFISLQFTSVNITTISPCLTQLHTFAENLLSKPTYSRLAVSCFSILQAYSFYYPECSGSIWELIWKYTLSACCEKTVQVRVAVEGFRVLSTLCQTVDKLPSCCSDIQNLFDNTALTNELQESGTGILRRSRRHKERSVQKYAIWRYEEIVQAVIQFVKAVAETESKTVFNSALDTSITKRILNSISSFIPSLTTINSKVSITTEVQAFCKMIIDICIGIVNVVDHPDIRAMAYQIMVSGLGSEYPPMIVLPCIVDLSIIEGNDRVKEVHRVLTGLLMNYKLANYQQVMIEVPKAMKRLIAGVTNSTIRQYLQNQFLVSCCQLCKNILTIDESAEMRSLQWKISESIIKVLSAIESRWDPYKPQMEVSVSLMKNYLDVWFQLVTIKCLSAEPWTKEGELSLTLFASKSPLLHKHFIDVEKNVEFSAMLASSNSNSNAQPLRAALISRLGEAYTADVTALDYSMALYLLTVYEVESRRAKQLNTVKAIFSYFSSIRDPTNPFYPVMSDILDVIFYQFVSQLLSMEQSEVTENILEDHMEFLLVQLCHRYVVLQDISLKYICKLLEHFHFLKTNASCLNVLIKCMLIIRKNLTPLDDAPVILHPDEVRVLKDDQPFHYEMMLPHRSDELEGLYEKIQSLFSSWLICEETGLEEEVLITLQNIASPEVFSFIYHLIMDDDKIKKQYTPFTDFLASIRVHSLNEKIGFWSGRFKERLMYVSLTEVIKELKEEMNFFIRSNHYSSNDDSLHYPKSVTYQVTIDDMNSLKPIEFLYKCAAVASLQRETVDPIVIKFICWLPGLLMEKEFMKEAIEVWRWLLAEIPLFHSLVIREICAAWHMTRTLGRGLFCVSDCWFHSHHRWYEGGIHHEGMKKNCRCGCHCGAVFKKVNARFNRKDSSPPLSLDIDEIENDIQISPLQRRPSSDVEDGSLCSSCCNCNSINEETTGSREKELSHVSLLYAPPTFIRDLCGVGAFTNTKYCHRVSLEECRCHGLWLGFFDEVLGAYADRYEDIVREICSMLFTSIQQELITANSCVSERLDFIICCWKSYELCKKYKLFDKNNLDEFYGAIIMCTINMIVYDNQDYNVLLSTKKEKVNKLKIHEVLSKMMFMYDCVKEVHLHNKEMLHKAKLSKKQIIKSSEGDTVEGDSLHHSLLHSFLQRHNGLINRSFESSTLHSLMDSQSLLGSSKNSGVVDHLTVITSTNSSSTIRFEELCLILLRGEMERLALQVNPCQNRYTLDASYTTQASNYTQNQWKEVMQLCSLHSAECTIKIVHLYPHVAVLNTELTRLICENPIHYIHCPESVIDYILDPSDDTKKWLLYWSTPSLPSIIATMSRNTAELKQETPPMSNPAVMTYLTKALGKFPPESLCFYLPQFVQGLRHDKTNKLQDYILLLCSRNILLTHQLLWALITESEQESTQVDKYGFSGNPLSGEDCLPQICQNIIDRIKNAFTPAQSLLYHQQFDFFNKLINISGLVKPLKKEDRKSAIEGYVSEMREGIEKKYIYLPTNPEYHIVDIIVNSAAAMQSAGKAPYLLQFKVEKWDGPDSVVKIIEDMNTVKVERRVLSHRSTRRIERKTTNQFYVPRTSSTVDSSISMNRIQSYRSLSIHVSGSSHLPNSPSTGVASPSLSTSHHYNSYQSLRDFEGVPSNDSHDSRESRDIQQLTTSLEVSQDLQESEQTEETFVKMGLILKAYDDCRQDTLALQVMHLLETIWESEGIDVPLMVYNVTPARTSDEHKAMGGIIECVQNSDSRDNLGKKGFTTLKSYYESLFGREDSKEYEMALRRFIRSSAAYQDLHSYAVACYILWVKDRHNGNLMIDTKGNLIHIDFGFLLGTSPGGNLGFETAAFKFSEEMYMLLGGNDDAYPLQEFLDLTVEAFLCIRKHWRDICNVINCMSDSGLPCFLPDTLVNLKKRFGPEESELVAARNMLTRSKDSIKKWTTIFYDGIQVLQNGIYSDAW